MRPLLRAFAARPTSTLFPRTGHLTKFQQQLTPASTTCLQHCQSHTSQLQLAWTRQSRFYSTEADKDKPQDREPAATPKAEEPAAKSPEPEVPSADNLRNLPSQQELRRSEASKRFSKAMDDLQTAALTAGQKFNILTGYSDIETLKKAIESQERHVQASRLAVRNAKEEYQNAIDRRSASQREVNELLQRKHAWSTMDLERFTELYRSDHTNEQAEHAAKEQLSQAERTADEAQDQLVRSIFAKYHEEQIWSDKIRRASTWGTWGLMGFNVLLVIVVQLGLEPWKRRRLVGGFEAKVREVIQEEVREVIQEENKKYALPSVAAAPVLEGGGASLVAENTTEVPAATETATETVEKIISDLVGAAAIEEAPVTIGLESETEVTAVGEGESIAEQQAWSRGETAVEHQAWALGERARQQVESVKEKAKALVGEQWVMLTQRELTTIVAEGVAVGVLTGLCMAIVRYLVANR